MKIIHCIDHYMPLHIAGTEIYVYTLASLQKAAGHDVAVLTPFFSYYPNRQFNEHYLYDGIDVYQYMEASNPGNKNYLFNKKLPEGIKEFEKKLDQLKPDVLHFHELTRSIGFGIEHIKIAKKKNIKIILTMHLAANTCNTNNLINNNKLCDGEILRYRCSVCTLKTLYKFPGFVSVPLASIGTIADKAGIAEKLPLGKITTILSTPLTIRKIKKRLDELIINVDQIVSLTDWYKDMLLRNGVPFSKITVIKQGLPGTKKYNTQKKNIKTNLPLKIVFIGRIQPQKGIHLLIDAMKYFKANEVQADIYGKPENTLYYQKCIADSKAINSITWKGLLKREDVLDTLAGYDILCLPSTFSEMSPLVIQEAFAAGVPVLASNVYGNAEQIKDGKNGLLFDFNSSKSLRKQLRLIIADLSLLQQFKNNIVAPNNFEAIAEAYIKLYQG